MALTVPVCGLGRASGEWPLVWVAKSKVSPPLAMVGQLSSVSTTPSPSSSSSYVGGAVEV